MAIVEIAEFSSAGNTPTVRGFLNSGTSTSMSVSITGASTGDACVSCATQSSTTATPPTFSGSGVGWNVATFTSEDDGVPSKSMRTHTHYIIPGSSGTQTDSVTTTLTTTWYFAGVDVVAGAASSMDPSLTQRQKKKRLWRRVIRHSKRRQAAGGGMASLIPLFPFARRRLRRLLPKRKRKPGLTKGTAAFINLFQFWKRRKRKAPRRPWQHHYTPFYGDITPIAPQGQCWTITVSEQLGARMIVQEQLLATELNIGRLGTMLISTSDKLSSTPWIEERLTATISIICCR
jgi:hypothetical protein